MPHPSMCQPPPTSVPMSPQVEHKPTPVMPPLTVLDVTLTTTNSNVTFSGTTNAASAGDTLTIAAGSGDVTFTGAVGGTTALGNTTITTGALSAANMTVQGTIDVTNTSASSITGVIADGASAATLTKAGSGTLILSGTNTFTGDLTISAGTVTMTGTLADTVDVINSGTYDVDASDTIQSLSGSGAVEIDTGVTLTFGDANDNTISGVSVEPVTSLKWVAVHKPYLAPTPTPATPPLVPVH